MDTRPTSLSKSDRSSIAKSIAGRRIGAGTQFGAVVALAPLLADAKAVIEIGDDDRLVEYRSVQKDSHDRLELRRLADQLEAGPPDLTGVLGWE
jgi:hypothetical protein